MYRVCMKVKCKSGVMGWRMKLRKNYANFEEWNYYAQMRGLHKRLGYSTPHRAWVSNPLIEGSVNPSDFRKVSVKKPLKYKQYVIVHFDNCGPSVQLFRSAKPITIDAVAEYLVKQDGFDDGRDSLTFVDAPEKTTIR